MQRVHAWCVHGGGAATPSPRSATRLHVHMHVRWREAGPFAGATLELGAYGNRVKRRTDPPPATASPLQGSKPLSHGRHPQRWRLAAEL